MPRKTTKPRVSKATSGTRQTAEYRHKEETPARPDVGVQPQFKKRAAPRAYRYLIIETKGYDELEDVKRGAVERWVRAVNSEGSFGTWRYAIAKSVPEVPKILSASTGA